MYYPTAYSRGVNENVLSQVEWLPVNSHKWTNKINARLAKSYIPDTR